ncbi:4-alpha-glucanotransferase [Nocardioides sp.]|uniref:4-alpha-glucanotransferase n=1 Tax=Nocardioides sp. TaxID=35761 RepID=UPI002B26845C|nr:4-alpha-glucanotransferase [Nocardioides sp.]
MTDSVDAWGIQRDWIDADDAPQRVPEATVRLMREAIGSPPSDLDERAPVVTRPGRATGLVGNVVCEDGTERRLDDVLPDDFPFGYHSLHTDGGVTRRLIVSPGECWLPSAQTWGWSVQLYAALSTSSRGIGDLADLRTLREWTEQAGGGFLLVNPLHATAPVLPQESSPYLPATRRFRNPLYLRLDDVPGAAAVLATGDHEPAPTARTIDRDAAWLHKRDVLRRAFDDTAAEDDPDLAAWRAEQGDALEEYAAWAVLAEEHGADWHAWPSDLRDPHGPAVRRLVVERADDIAFHAWLQWQLAEQLREATGDLTVIQDLPIGVSGGGADAWAWQGVLADGITVGCPPDALNSSGQDWGSPPLTPWRLREADYEPFIESVRATIAGAGGIRIDHVMGLFRLWWIPNGEVATAGCYVRYPADDLLDIVCLESHRAQAVVIGEDLGTVEDGVTEALSERNILSYRVLWFEDDEPSTWPELSLATITTHDLPTIAGLWSGSDVEDVLESSDMNEPDVRAGRAELLERLERSGVAKGDEVADVVPAAYARLGTASSLLLALSLEDAVLEERRPNVPGTTADQRDNWCVPLAVDVDALGDLDSPRAIVRAVTQTT